MDHNNFLELRIHEDRIICDGATVAVLTEDVPQWVRDRFERWIRTFGQKIQ